MKEIIICAAIRVGDKIWRGHRHGHCFTALNDELSYDYNRREIAQMPKEQGFITSKNRFVDRKEGLKLQLAAGIPCKDGEYTKKELFSEDLY